MNGTGIDYKFDNWFAVPAGPDGFETTAGDTFPDTVSANEDFSVIKIDSKINTAKEAMRALLDVSGGNQIFTLINPDPNLESPITAPQYYELLSEDSTISTKYISSQATQENVDIDFSDTLDAALDDDSNQHFHGRSQSIVGNFGRPWDPIGFGYLNNIMNGMGQFIAAQSRFKWCHGRI